MPALDPQSPHSPDPFLFCYLEARIESFTNISTIKLRGKYIQRIDVAKLETDAFTQHRFLLLQILV